ncbi:PD-(D/E)XK motif protein [Streptomyces zhihengii]
MVWLRCTPCAPSAGTRFLELVESVLRQCDDEPALLDLLAAAGYRQADAAFYKDACFVVEEERWYAVGPGFPGLTHRALAHAGLTATVTDVDYTIDLSGDLPAAMTTDEIAQYIECLVQESV